MNQLFMNGFVAACSVFVLASAGHAQVYKCQDGGRTVYSQEPCPTSGKKLDIQSASPRVGSLAERQAMQERYIQANPGLPDTVKSAIRGFVAIPGMTEEQVLLALGNPVDRNLTQTAQSSTWQWVYRYPSGKQHYVYIENGVVVATN
ncbi:DUF4124 domain-containing protein [Azoarcus communis]|uniref:DUF4124 domain-containing protein n=1 Tax=Parazoarcus communis TaxID=41977 RepID=UPI001459F606|nr:DUF4124 domain-containing protein [Parazoarcus communis]NMG48274.1 DUF4124 domain-containing protein [Parazoarcus communis]